MRKESKYGEQRSFMDLRETQIYIVNHYFYVPQTYSRLVIRFGLYIESIKIHLKENLFSHG